MTNDAGMMFQPMKAWATTITCFAAALIGASAQGRDVSGQVFVVTKGHESVKLGATLLDSL
jgi:hypothetical protein